MKTIGDIAMLIADFIVMVIIVFSAVQVVLFLTWIVTHAVDRYFLTSVFM